MYKKIGISTYDMKSILKMDPNVDFNFVTNAINSGSTVSQIKNEIKKGNFQVHATIPEKREDIIVPDKIEESHLKQYTTLSNVSFQSKEDTERQVKNALERMQEQEESYKTIQKEMDEINEARLNILNDNFKEIMAKTSLSNKIPKEQMFTNIDLPEYKNEFSSFEQKNFENINPNINYQHAKEAKDAGLTNVEIKNLLKKNLEINLSDISKAKKAGWAYYQLSTFLQCKSDVNFQEVAETQLKYAEIMRKLKNNESLI